MVITVARLRFKLRRSFELFRPLPYPLKCFCKTSVKFAHWILRLFKRILFLASYSSCACGIMFYLSSLHVHIPALMFWCWGVGLFHIVLRRLLRVFQLQCMRALILLQADKTTQPKQKKHSNNKAKMRQATRPYHTRTQDTGKKAAWQYKIYIAELHHQMPPHIEDCSNVWLGNFSTTKQTLL
jgi:hypothetical protein